MIHDPNIKNIVVLGKWLGKLHTTNGTWQQLNHNDKYLGSESLAY